MISGQWLSFEQAKISSTLKSGFIRHLLNRHHIMSGKTHKTVWRRFALGHILGCTGSVSNCKPWSVAFSHRARAQPRLWALCHSPAELWATIDLLGILTIGRRRLTRRVKKEKLLSHLLHLTISIVEPKSIGRGKLFACKPIQTAIECVGCLPNPI